MSFFVVRDTPLTGQLSLKTQLEIAGFHVILQYFNGFTVLFVQLKKMNRESKVSSCF